MESKSCHRHPVSVGPFAMVEQCSCGTIHLTVGPVTVRVPREALQSLASTLGEASRSLAISPLTPPAAFVDDETLS